jgi:hypothetical protein
MKNAASLLFLLLLSIIFLNLPAEAQESNDNPFKKLEISIGPLRPPQRLKSSQIKDIQVFGEGSGIGYTSDTLFRTDDNGENWYEINLSLDSNETISSVYFLNENRGWAILADAQNARLELAKTEDGGYSWTRTAINIRTEDLEEANLDVAQWFFIDDEDTGSFRLDLASSSNFERTIRFVTKDGGQTWEGGPREAEKSRNEREYCCGFSNLKRDWGWMKEAFPDRLKLGEIPSDNVIRQHGGRVPHSTFSEHSIWHLTQNGRCEGVKTGCTQITKIYKDASSQMSGVTTITYGEITPPQIKELAQREKENAKLEARNSIFAAPPGGSTRISLNRGFDKCTAAPASQMQTWWDNSYFYDSNIYISGRNRGCSQPQLTAAWINQVSAMGWGLIPTIVGYQAPCSACTTCQKHSSDAATAETQGRGEADIAIADANNLGLTQGTVLYYDMERYDDVSGTGACSTPVKSFLKGWTDRLHEQGYVSGVYGSPTNAVGDWINIPEASRMDAVWLARWDNVPSVWFYASPSPVVPDTAWANHQRIKQWQAPHNETWGGVTFNIDGNIADAPVAGIQPAKNKTADFDGDGKTDVSVWRPDTGVWYITNSSNASYTIQGFGLSTDILAPGDFDGDGKTDLAVWRSGEGVWHLYSRSIYRSYQFGSTGDIPVPADYDGDGRADLAVFRPSTGVWYVWNSFDSRGTSFRIEQFGLNGDKPVTGDYDGDGKADLAVWRPSDGIWYLLRSSQGFTAINFGISTDKPAQGDYDGDGKTDLGIFRDGVWYLYQSQAGVLVFQFGLAGDLPVTGDFDGDNKADISVFRPSSGVWYMQQSTNGFSAVQFGINGDKPIPNAYLPQ